MGHDNIYGSSVLFSFSSFNHLYIRKSLAFTSYNSMKFITLHMINILVMVFSNIAEAIHFSIVFSNILLMFGPIYY